MTIVVRYFTDSLVNKIYAYDYNDGKLSGRRVFVDPLSHGLPEGTYPDGLCIDNAGGIWSARHASLVRHGAYRTDSIAHFALGGAGPESSGTLRMAWSIYKWSSPRHSTSLPAASEVKLS